MIQQYRELRWRQNRKTQERSKCLYNLAGQLTKETYPSLRAVSYACDDTGRLASGGILARHDYLPFGEEIDAGTGLRTSAQGYGAADERKQKYALLERDAETGQDHALWR
jgi:YD repeat-containing protein